MTPVRSDLPLLTNTTAKVATPSPGPTSVFAILLLGTDEFALKLFVQKASKKAGGLSVFGPFSRNTGLLLLADCA